MSFLKSSPPDLLETHGRVFLLEKNEVLWAPFGHAYLPVALASTSTPGKAHKKVSIQYPKRSSGVADPRMFGTMVVQPILSADDKDKDASVRKRVTMFLNGAEDIMPPSWSKFLGYMDYKASVCY